MLRSVLSPEECAACRFCCSFRRCSLWETPLFEEENVSKLKQNYPDARFKCLPDGSVTFDIDDCYRTDDSEEEALCPFNRNGCVLGKDEKPFDCSIWPLRVMRKDGELVIALTPTCPAINAKPIERMQELVDSGLGDIIFERARQFPLMIKEYREGFPVLAREQ